MNRTKAIFIVATLLSGVALYLTLQGPATARPPVPLPPGPDPSVPAVNGQVSLEASVSHPHVLAAKPNDLFFQVDVRGHAGKVRGRLPLDIGLVIDRSGSMSGSKLSYAKAAARKLVRQLADGDRLAILTYGSDVTTLVPATRLDRGNRASIIQRINGIHDYGGTFLSGALQRATAALRDTLTAQRLARVILISDGQANEGITTQAGLSRLARQAAGHGVAVTTMGVGLHFNEDTLTAMAEHGNGHYYFIRDASSLTAIFERELDKLVSTVARRPVLDITLAPGAELVQLYGYEMRRHGRRVRIQLPALFAKQHRRITMKVRLRAPSAARQVLADVKLRYVCAADLTAKSLTTAARVVGTHDPALVQRSLRREVFARGQQVELALTTRQALQEYARGNVQKAQTQLRTRLRALQRINVGLSSKRLRRSLRDTRKILRRTRAAPSSAAGQATIKAGKASAYELAK